MRAAAKAMHRRLLPFLLSVLATQALPAAAGEPLGRLILTPAERQARDRQRQANPAYLPANAGGERPLQTIGELQSSSGRHRRWQADGSDAAVAPRLPVGDRLHPATGLHERLLGDGRLRIRRPGAADAPR